MNELNYLRSMINMLLPPLYQQHYFAQPQPQLYQPLPSPPSNSSNSNSVQSSQTSEAVSHVSDQIQNESPYSVSPTVESPPTSTDVPLTKNTTSIEDSTESITEKQLEFKPVQKKITDRNKSFPKLVKFVALNVLKFLNLMVIFAFIFCRTKTGPRESEIHKLNNTILSGAGLQIFNYYWKIEQFSEKLKSNVTTLNSPIFSIAGLYLRIKATLNNLGRDFLHLQLEQLTMDKAGDKSNIILKTGDMFKRIQTKISFKHKIAILDQVSVVLHKKTCFQFAQNRSQCE